ncbi:MAG: P-type ATPase-like protein [Linnemannia gamsii]|nr:MAG: P-type ATPase-like protein [Linnemannia gamsii]
MVNTPSHDPLSSRLFDQHGDTISQAQGTQGRASLLPSGQQGSQPYPSTTQTNNHDDSVVHTGREASSFARAPTIRSVSSRFQLHQVDNDDNDNDDNEDDEDEDDDEDDGVSAMQPILQTKAAARPRPVKRSPADGQRWDRCEQKVYLEEEDIELTFIGYRFLQTRLYIYYLACVLSGGVLFLLGRWMPQRYLAFAAEKCDMSQAESVVVEDAWGQLVTEVVFTKYYGGPINSVFSPEQMEKQEDDEGFDEALSTGMLHDMRYFDYQYIRFIYNPVTYSFMQNSKWKDPEWSNIITCDRGIGRETQQERTMVFGQNVIDVKEKTVGQLLVQEVLHPFYIFQVFSMALWLADDYIYYAGCIFVISTVSVLTELVETKKTMKRMRTMSKFICNVKVFRSGRWRYLGSEELVPGDVFETTDSDLSVFPCDAILLSGDCIVNESMLTGESVPVSKIPITDKALQQLDLSLANIPSDLARHFLFSGTKIIRARPGAASPKKQVRTDDVDYGVNQAPRGLALVVRTGFNTTKGSLIRSMLFPKPNDFQFYRDSFRFIGILAGIAFCGFLVSTVNFIRMDVPFKFMIIKALDLITIVVPPALPATMSIGTSFAIARLKRSNIFCISPSRVNIGGKINCMCFDKTGTLTEDGLDVLGVQCADAETGRFGTLLNRVEDLRAVPDSMQERATSLLFSMTTCHSVKSLNGELIGDPLDLKMFDFTQWILEEGGLGARTSSVSEAAHNQSKGITGGIVSTVVRPPGAKQFNLNDVLTHNATEMSESETFLELGIIRCFEFVSSLRRMSVIVKKLHSPGMDIYVKGAPEAMTDICLKESLPSDYAERLSHYTQHGYRVIACATKSMPNLNFVRAQRVKREQVESDLTFLGLIVFENKLKPTTAPIIATLSNAQIRQVMCTGDNVLTAISVSKECGLIQPSKEVYIPRFIMGDSTTENSRIIWENTNDRHKTLDPMSLMPITSSFETMSSGQDFPRYTHLLNDYALAVTGDCFRWMVDFAPKSTLHRMLVKGQIFARMSPDEKHELVENLQAIGYCVGFCGDGANDCGALKAADVGISLSEAEASVAAPFTSRSNDIGCVVKVIQEGRAALVTSFSCFKYMALYSIIQFTTVSLLYAFASNLGDFQFLYIDLALILPIAVFMGRTEAFPVLSPKRPTANLVSKKVLTSLIGQILIQGCFQATVFSIVRHQSWYKPPRYERGEKNIEGFENTSLFLLSIFQYLLVAIVFSVGPPYRKPMSSNRPFVFITAGLVLMSASMVLFPSEWLKSFMQLLDIPFTFKLFILLMAGLHLVIALTSEHFVFPVLATKIGQVIQSIRKQSSSSPSLSVPTTTTRRMSTSQRDPHRRSAQYGDEARIEVGQGEDEVGSGPGTPLIGSHPQNPFDQISCSGSGSAAKEGAKKGKIYKVVQEEMNGI